MPDKAAFVSAVLFVYSVTGENDVSLLQKRHLVGKNSFAFSFRPMLKDKQVGGNMLMFHVDVKQRLVLKTTRFNDSESTLSFERQ